MSSETCQKFLRLGPPVTRRIDRREGQDRVVEEDVWAAEPLTRDRDDAVAVGWPA
jgi:hypothetical protein